jgi:hypothetical protein
MWQGNWLDGIGQSVPERTLEPVLDSVAMLDSVAVAAESPKCAPMVECPVLDVDDEGSVAIDEIMLSTYDDHAIAKINYYNSQKAQPAATQTIRRTPPASVAPRTQSAPSTAKTPAATAPPPASAGEYGTEYRAWREVQYSQAVHTQSDLKDIPIVHKSHSKIARQAPISYYHQIADQLDELFEAFPDEPRLAVLLPDTKWVKVDYDNTGRYYVVGVIGKAKPSHICYGVPGVYSPTPPQEFGYCQWLPIDTDPKGRGYWLMYQDAITGESVGG